MRASACRCYAAVAAAFKGGVVRFHGSPLSGEGAGGKPEISAVRSGHGPLGGKSKPRPPDEGGRGRGSRSARILKPRMTRMYTDRRKGNAWRHPCQSVQFDLRSIFGFASGCGSKTLNPEPRKPRVTRMYSAGLVYNNFSWVIVPPSLRRAVGTRGGGRTAVPRLAPWAGMRRRVATGGAAAPRLFVICYLGAGAFSFSIHDL